MFCVSEPGAICYVIMNYIAKNVGTYMVLCFSITSITMLCVYLSSNTLNACFI